VWELASPGNSYAFTCKLGEGPLGSMNLWLRNPDLSLITANGDYWRDSRWGGTGIHGPLAGNNWTDPTPGWVFNENGQNAHWPEFALLPYVTTGRRYYRDNLARMAWALWANIWPSQSTQYGQQETMNARGLTPPTLKATSGVAWQAQGRGAAWSLRSVVMAASWLDDGSAEKSWASSVTNLTLTEMARWAASPMTNGSLPGWDGHWGDPGFTPSGYFVVVNYWLNYQAWAIEYASDQGFTQANAWRDSVAAYSNRLITSGNNDPAGSNWFPQSGACPEDHPVGLGHSDGQHIHADTFYTTLTEVGNACVATGFASGFNTSTFRSDGYVMALIGLRHGTDPNAQAALTALQGGVTGLP
jgi:hypothetical protein